MTAVARLLTTVDVAVVLSDRVLERIARR